jgi:membrane dipeptidase
MARPPRLIDLHIPWLEQYATETTLFDPALYPEVPGRLAQVEGYLGATWAAVVTVGRKAAEWQGSADRWRALSDMFARVEAEFCGRMLIGPADHARWRDDPRGLTWALAGASDLGLLIDSPADLDHLPRLFERGLRSFHLGREPACDRADLLGVLAGLAATPEGPRPLLDLAGLDACSVDATLAWFESDPARAGRLIPYRSHGSLRDASFPPELRGRLRALGGLIGVSVGPPFHDDPEAFRADLEAEGPDGLAIGTGFLHLEGALPGLGSAEAVAAKIASQFPAEAAARLIQGNAAELLARATGAGALTGAAGRS